MNTSPILAATSFPSPATANPGGAADSSDFHQVLQQLRPLPHPVTAPMQIPIRPMQERRLRIQPLPPARPPQPALRDFSAAAIAGTNRSSTAGSAKATLLAGLTANRQQSGATNVSPGAKITKKLDKNSIGDNEDTTEAIAAGTPKTEKARTKSAANPIAVPVVAPFTPAPDPSAFSSALLVTAKAQQSAIPQLSDNFTLEPAAIVAPDDVIRGRAATAAAAIGHTTDDLCCGQRWPSGGPHFRDCSRPCAGPTHIGIFHRRGFRLRHAFRKIQGQAATRDFFWESR